MASAQQRSLAAMQDAVVPRRKSCNTPAQSTVRQHCRALAATRPSEPSSRVRNVIATLCRSSWEEASTMQLTQKHREYWNKNLRITAILLFIWFLVTFVIGFYARELSFNFFGWPFAFYMGAQGSLIIYVIIIWYYARYMNQLDKDYDVHEGEED
jgi:putative solute:sodium symporter small subunit